jgi:Putative MetA-pathway of phenol degradation
MPRKAFLVVCVAGIVAGMGCAQDLAPRAYLITPTGSNAVILSYSFFDGSVFTDPTLPIQDFKARYHAEVVSYYHALGFFGRSANVTGSFPYALGNFHAIVAGAENGVYRSGLADARVRFAVNLKGGPAMSLNEYLDWQEKTVLGASLTVVAPTGQYDPARVINPSLHRWAFKPELGISHRWHNRWALDLYAGGWFFTANNQYYPGPYTRNQEPIAVGEAHLTYYVKPRLWASLDGNFWAGGQSTVNGIHNADYQRNSRVGATIAIPLNQHQTLKFSYSRGAYIAIGGDYQNVSAGWAYSWIRSGSPTTQSTGRSSGLPRNFQGR